MNHHLHLAFTFDSNYLPHFYVVMLSILDHHSSEELHLHLIPFQLSDKEEEQLRNYLKSKGVAFSTYSVDHADIKNFQSTIKDGWSLAVYLKIFFPTLVSSQTDRLLFIDSDTVVLNSLSPLYNTNIANYPLAAVYDCYVGKRPDLAIFEEGAYFNSGVMLINVSRWIDLNITNKALGFASRNPDKIRFVDQDALNAVILGNWLRLAPKYNLLYSYINPDADKRQYDQITKESIIVHFTLQKPWQMLCENRFRKLYKFYWKRTPLRGRNPIKDFEWSKMRKFMMLRLRELYLDSFILHKSWRFIRRLMT